MFTAPRNSTKKRCLSCVEMPWVAIVTLAFVQFFSSGAGAADIDAGSGQLESINSGSVTAFGVFQGDPMQPAIGEDGEANVMSVSAAGAAVNVSATSMVRPPAEGEGDTSFTGANATISFGSINARAENSGAVSANGTFEGMGVGPRGRRNNMSVQAVGASVSVSTTGSR